VPRSTSRDLAQGRRPKKAKEIIDRVFTGSIDYDPEGRRMKAFAKSVALKIEEELK